MRSNAAATYDDQPWARAMLEQLSGEIRSRLDWIGVNWVERKDGGEALTAESPIQKIGHVRMLDYACGPGMASAV